MKKIILLFYLLYGVVSLEAYAKRVILATFSTPDRAQKMMQDLPTLSPTLYKLSQKYDFQVKMKPSGKYHILYVEVFRDKEVLNTALKSIRKLFPGAYISSHRFTQEELESLLAPEEGSEDSQVSEQMQERVISSRESKPEPIIDKEPEVLEESIVEEEQEVQVTKPKIEEDPKAKVTMVKELSEVISQEPHSSLTQELEQKKNLEGAEMNPSILHQLFSEYFNWVYFVLFIVAGVMFYYYRKFKKIYDEY